MRVRKKDIVVSFTSAALQTIFNGRSAFLTLFRKFFTMAGLIRAIRPVAETFAKNAIYYGKVELIPPKPSELGQIKDSICNILSGYKNGRWKQLTVREAWLNTLVTAEVIGWFFIGEVIGRRSLIGYKV